jgi:ribosomal subunit interface protein
MNIKVTFRHMQHSPVIEEHIRKQLKKIIEFLEHERSPVYVELTLTPSKVHDHHHAELLVKSPRYDLFNDYEHQGLDMYGLIDHVIDVMYRRLLEEKDRIKKDERKMQGRHADFKKQR